MKYACLDLIKVCDIMVRKCCVPGCKTSSRFSNHRLPTKDLKAQKWLRIIGLNNMIDASNEEKAKLRICFLHFPDEMIKPYGQRRCLMDDAIPTLHLSNVTIAADCVSPSSTGSNTITPLESSEDIGNNSNFVKQETELKHVDVTTVSMANVRHICDKIRRHRAHLRNQKHVIQRTKQCRMLHKKNEETWNNMMTDFPSIKKIFLNMIHDNFQHVSQGCLYETKQMTLALMLYKTMGERAYTCLRDVFKHIPCIETLQLMLQEISTAPGLNPLILQYLKNMSQKMSSKDKVCILMWDSIPIQSHVTYNIRKDIIYGFEDWNKIRTNKVADHALVFMLRGLYTGWKMPISYIFCAKMTNSVSLVGCIKQYVHVIHEAGFHIVATVCNQGSANIAAIKQLLLQTDIKRNFERKTRTQTFEVGNVEIVPLFDPPHLIKDIRNNLLTKDLAMSCENNIPTRIASWDVIKTAWIMDKKINIIRPQLKKITKKHIIENKIKKRHVTYATQVLSGTVASCIETFARLQYVTMENTSTIGIDAEEGVATAETINFFNDLFDSVNSSEKSDNNLRCAVTVDSVHHAFWKNAKNVLGQMCYVDKTTREIIKTVPTLRNWLFTLDGFENLWNILKCKYNFTSFKTCYCNQDPIEDFLDQVRSHTVQNTNPVCQQFEDSFITLLVSNMKSVKIVGYNCEIVEDPFMLPSFEQYLEYKLQNVKVYDIHKNNDVDEPLEVVSKVSCDDDNYLFLLYHSDYIINIIIKYLNSCKECNDSLRSSNFFSACAKQVIYRILKFLQTRCHRRNILKLLLQHFEDWTINMDWHKCVEHHDNMFITMVRIISIKILAWWCDQKNILMRNTDDDSNINLLCCEEIEQIKKVRETYRLTKSKRRTMLNEYKLFVRKRMNK